MESLLTTIKAKHVSHQNHAKKGVRHGGFKRSDTFGSVESRLGFHRHQTPTEIIQNAIENGKNMVDLSYRMLKTVPRDIEDLQHGVCFRANEPLRPRLQLALNANLLADLPRALFRIDSITVLNLDNNRVTNLPPDIIQIVNLEMLSVGRNKLGYLPDEIRRLPKLNRLTCFPNPFVKKEQEKEPSIRPLKQPWSLRSQAGMVVLNRSLKYVDVVPYHVSEELDHASHVNQCPRCDKKFLTSVDEIVWEDFLENEKIPFQVRYCSPACHQHIFTE